MHECITNLKRKRLITSFSITRFWLFNMYAVFVAVALFGCSTIESENVMPINASVEQAPITIHSSSGPPISLWSMNEEIGKQLTACKIASTVEVLPSALPESINDVGHWHNRGVHFPMVTPVDFEPAVDGDGPVAWHDYPQSHADLKFIASLYEVGFGVLVFDDNIRTVEDLKGKTIAVARRPSSLRVLADALLRDAWGILDDVTLIDLPPHGVEKAVSEGRVDATTWSLMIETPEGYRPLTPALLSLGHWIPVSAQDIARINAKSRFRTAIATIDNIIGNPESRLSESVDLVSFDQGLAGWSSSDDAHVSAILECLSNSESRRLMKMSEWPGINKGMLHPAAMEFYMRADPNFLERQSD